MSDCAGTPPRILAPMTRRHASTVPVSRRSFAASRTDQAVSTKGLSGAIVIDNHCGDARLEFKNIIAAPCQIVQRSEGAAHTAASAARARTVRVPGFGD